MSEELISKKELLEVMNISYGQLYRWKRKNLIPEEWFIKKSVSTGQETFMPREKILERVATILDLKDDVSLDDLASKLTGVKKYLKITRSYLENHIKLPIIERFEQVIKVNELYEEKDIFALYIYNKLINLGSLNLQEVSEITKLSNNDYSKFIATIEGKDYSLIIKRKFGVCYYYIIVDKLDIYNEEENSILIAKVHLNKVIEEIKKIA